MALANLLADRAMAKSHGELQNQKRKRMIKELRFRQRILKESGLQP